jgi:hypothetical protein
LEKLSETLLGDEVQQVIDFVGIFHPAANGFLHGRRYVDHPAPVVQANGQIERSMFLSALAMTAGLAAGAGHGDETAAEQWIFGDVLDGAGAGVALLARALRPGFHGGLLSDRA